MAFMFMAGFPCHGLQCQGSGIRVLLTSPAFRHMRHHRGRQETMLEPAYGVAAGMSVKQFTNRRGILSSQGERQ